VHRPAIDEGILLAQPQITYPQNPLSSTTVLVNVFGSVLTWAVTKYGLGAIFPPDQVNQIATVAALAVMGAANIVVRKYLTAGALSFSAPLTQPASQDLPTGTSAVTVQHPTIGGPAAVVALQPGQQTITVPAHLVQPPPPAAVVVQPPAVAVVIAPPQA
jgi:hypothetical protein